MTSYRVSHDAGTWVTTSDGPVFLGQGATLPEEGIHPDEIARLANGGVLEGYDQVPELAGFGDELDGPLNPEALPTGGVEEIKTRVGSDPDVAQAYLEQEQARERPRPTLVKHLEQVIADADDSTDPGAPLVDETREG